MRVRKITFISIIMVFLTGIIVPNVLAEKPSAQNCQSIDVKTLEGEARQKAIDDALVNSQVKSLQKILEEQDHKLYLEASTVTKIYCDDKEVVAIGIIPFLMDEDEYGSHIAFWDGQWQEERERGVVAVVKNREEILVADGEETTSKSKEQFYDDVKIPLLSIPATVPEIMPKAEGQEIQEENTNLSTQCKTVDRHVTQYTALGFVAYKFHQQKYWCYDGTKVSNVNVSSYVSQVDSKYYYQGIVGQWDNFPSPYTYHESYRQGRLDNCVPVWGCIASYYPSLRVIVYGNGTYTYQGNPG